MDQPISTQPTRRHFLAGTAATLSGLAVHSSLQAQPSRSTLEKLNLAAVGTANKAGHNIDQLASQNFVALCDVDATFLGKMQAKWKGARGYQDFRRMLDKEEKNIDAVVVSTTDHCHAPATAMALGMKKHVYCEKPLTHSVEEARFIAQLAKKQGVATQMGTQIHATDNYRRVVEWVQSGAIGEVKEVYCWCNKDWSNGKFGPPLDPPSHLNWDLWLGPAASRPYSRSIHPGNWRRFWEYGSGTFGDMACHVMDLPFWALNLRFPTSVVAEGSPVDPVGTAKWVKARYEFPTDNGKLTFHWSDGNAHFDRVSQTKDPSGKPLSQWGLGVLFVGTQGDLVADYGRRILLPADKFEGFEAPAKSIADSIGHWNEWVQACKTGSATTCNFDYSGALTETVLLGVVAYRAQKALQWDAAKLEATNCPEATPLVRKSYRDGFDPHKLA